jgi:hypothetical protein
MTDVLPSVFGDGGAREADPVTLFASLQRGGLPIDLDGIAQGIVKPFRQEATFTRPADTSAYAIGDLIANSTTAASVVPMEFTAGRFDAANALQNRSVIITSARIIAATGAPTILPRLNLYATNGPFAAGSYPADNASLRGASGALTVAALSIEQVVGDVTAWTQASASSAYADLTLSTPLAITTDTSGKLRGLLEARNAATPTSALAYTVILRGLH